MRVLLTNPWTSTKSSASLRSGGSLEYPTIRKIQVERKHIVALTPRVREEALVMEAPSSIVITGVSSGIGRASLQKLLSHGFIVFGR